MMKRILALLLLGAALSAACARKPDMNMPHIQLAHRFATALSQGAFDSAHELLSADLRKDYPAARLKKQYEDMVAYGGEPVTRVDVITTMDRWPDERPGDVGWVYVSIAGETFGEAVTVVVAREGDRLVIRSLEWGRP
jgi:hypothetical protein